jgi:hypothetical protein
MEIKLGQRISVPNKGNGTVRWIGRLKDLESLRAGIELDEPCESCHSGDYLGKIYFACKPWKGIFLKTNKVDCGQTFESAIKSRYMTKSNELRSENVSAQHNSKIKVELVGQDKAEHFFAENVYDLRELAVDGMKVNNCFAGSMFKQLNRLSLRENLIHDLGDVVGLCKNTSSLSEIDLSGNFFTAFHGSEEACMHVKKIILINCQFESQIIFQKFISVFANLTSLSLDKVDLDLTSVEFPPSLQSLSLQICGISEWSTLRTLLSKQPGLQELDISGNSQLGDLRSPDTLSTLPFKMIESLNIVDCGISEWRSIRIITEIFPNLRSLSITNNLVYQDQENLSVRRQVLISAFPHLGTLNNANISYTQRREAHRYVSTLIFRKIDWVVEALSLTRQEELLTLHAPTIDECLSKTSVNSVQKLSISLILKTATGDRISFRVPTQCRYSDLHATVIRKAKWPFQPNQLRILISPTESVEEAIETETFGDISDLNVADGWFVFTAFIDSNV